MSKTAGISAGALALIVGAGLTLASCGHPSSSSEQEAATEGATRVIGKGGFGTQCPYGSVPDPKQVKLEMLDCPGLDHFELQQNLRPIVLQADCKKMDVTARDDHRTLDTDWKVKPDGSFEFTIDGGVANFANDGSGACSTPLIATVSGKLDCKNRDQVTMTLDTQWSMGKPMDPANPPALPQRACRLSDKCYLHAITQLNQCQ